MVALFIIGHHKLYTEQGWIPVFILMTECHKNWNLNGYIGIWICQDHLICKTRHSDKKLCTGCIAKADIETPPLIIHHWCITPNTIGVLHQTPSSNTEHQAVTPDKTSKYYKFTRSSPITQLLVMSTATLTALKQTTPIFSVFKGVVWMTFRFIVSNLLTN